MKQHAILVLLLLVALLPCTLRAQSTTPDDTSTTTTAETPPADTVPAPPAATASLNPDISVIGNLKGTLANQGVDADTNRHLQLDELEMVIGSKIYPGVSALAVLTAGAKEPVGIEEAYISDEQFFSNVPIGGRLGIVRLPFGKANPLHPHSLPYADTASVLNNLLGEFRGNGFEAVGIIPTHSNIFLQAQLGRWKSVGDAPEGAPDFSDEAMTLGRLWASTAIGADNELELGASGAFGEAGIGGKINLIGLDSTWRHFLPGERRIMLQGEAMQRTDADVKSYGYYLLGTYRPNHIYEFGTRYDWSEFANDNTHHESYLSLFATRFLSEATYLRLQAKHGANHDGRQVNELIAQIVFGFGPHTHPLQ